MNVVVFGATGAVGNALVKNLLEDQKVSKVYLLTRRQTRFNQESKVSEIIIPEMSVEKILDLKIKADHFICTLGTTIKKAKTKDKFRFVDYDLVLAFARLAKMETLKSFHVVSSIKEVIRLFVFLRQKWGLRNERDEFLGFQSLFIYRPSLLITNREEFRFGEKVGIIP